MKQTNNKPNQNKVTRRQFIGSTGMALAGLSLSSGPLFSANTYSFDAKGLPTRPFADFGFKVPLLGYGCGNRWMGQDEDKALEALSYALDQGIFYWDTAPTYSVDKKNFSEIRIGKILPARRKEVFLVTKIQDRDPEVAKHTIERSLKRLRTDYINLLHVHSIKTVEEAESIGKLGGILELLRNYKQQGIVKHIGFTGHLHAGAMKRVAELYNDLEVMMIALNHSDQMAWAKVKDNTFEETAVPYAAQKNLAVIAMKVIRPRETVAGLSVEQLIRYALTYQQFSTAVISMQSKQEVQENLSIIKNFKPMTAPEMQETRIALEPFYQGHQLAWMQPGYEDGSSSSWQRKYA